MSWINAVWYSAHTAALSFRTLYFANLPYTSASRVIQRKAERIGAMAAISFEGETIILDSGRQPSK